MSFLDFFRKKKKSKNTDIVKSTSPDHCQTTIGTPIFQLRIEAERLLSQANLSAEMANRTSNPEMFFSAYEDTIQALRQLVPMESFISFSGRAPSAILAELESKGKIEAAISDMIDRCINNHRWRSGQQAVEELSPYWDKISQSVRERIEQLSPTQTKSSQFSLEEYDRANEQQIKAFKTAFDLTTVSGIRSITFEAVKPWIQSAPGVPSHPVEILSKQASAYEREHIDLAVECLRKANELRPVSGMVYSEDSYLRLARYLYKAERFAEGDLEYQRIQQMFHGENASLPTSHSLGIKAIEKMIKLAQSDHTDLVEVSWAETCCPICGKYRGRIFSLSGADPRFPKFPSDFCVDCGLSVFPFHEGISRPMYSSPSHWIEDNQRPLVDNRTAAEKDAYLQRIQRQQREKAHQLAYMARERKDHLDYAWIRENLPDLLPKTFSGYRRMKTMNTANFQKLQARARELGHEL